MPASWFGKFKIDSEILIMITLSLQRTQSLRFTLLNLCLATCLISFLPVSQCVAATRGQFNFAVNPIVTGVDNTNDTAELRKVIINFWQAYLQLDAHNYLEQFTTDALRLSSKCVGCISGVPCTTTV